MDSLPPTAARCADHLARALHHLRAARDPADAAHRLLVDHDLAPDAPGYLPDSVAEAIAVAEAQLREIGARIPPEAPVDEGIRMSPGLRGRIEGWVGIIAILGECHGDEHLREQLARLSVNMVATVAEATAPAAQRAAA